MVSKLMDLPFDTELAKRNHSRVEDVRNTRCRCDEANSEHSQKGTDRSRPCHEDSLEICGSLID